MWLPPRKQYIRESKFTPGGVLLLGSTLRVNIDRTFPLEEIWVGGWFTNGNPVPTSAGPDGMMSLVKRVTLEINDGVQPRKVVDYSGAGLLDYCLHVSGNLDRATMEAKRALTVSATNRIWYRIPLVHPSIYGPLRTQMLLPIHQHPQDPVLQIEFSTNSATSLYSANPPSAIGCEVVLLRRAMTQAVDKAVMSNGGYIPFDLVQTSLTMPLATGEFRFQVVTPGQYANLHMQHYLGGGSITRADISDTTVGAESNWRLESGGSVISEWRLQQLKAINEVTMCFDKQTVGAGNDVLFPGNYCLDFLTDGTVDADELGSLLDCNLPAASGLKMEIISTNAGTASNGSILVVGGHRYFGDLSRWQAKK